MLDAGIILGISFGYMGLLFAIAYFGARRADSGRSIVSNPYVYALSLAVYCTAWTFYGSVGRAARVGPGFLTIYVGPTLTAALGWLVLRKIIRISKIHNITSIADFIASRYGKSSVLGGLVAIIAVLGIVPYISIQLQAISNSFLIIREYPQVIMPKHLLNVSVFKDTAFYVAIILTVFSILFGTRHLEATERHEGLVTAIAFESVVKLFAFLAVGFFVTYGIYGGFSNIFNKALKVPEIRKILTISREPAAYLDWAIYLYLSMMAVIFLPRQFQVTIVENVNEDHLKKAMWLFPLYIFAINIFVLPVAIGGLLHFPAGEVDADTFVLSIPMVHQRPALALFVYIGGMSAATSMVIVETIALSTMLCNDLVMPVLLRLPYFEISRRPDMSSLLIVIRRLSIITVMLLGYMYYRFIGEFFTLVFTGLISFVAVTQFAPAIIGGIFWKGGNRAGAMCGLVAGFIVWGYTLFLPSMVQTGLLPKQFITNGPFGISFLKPYELFGLQGMDYVAHAVFWSMLFNIGCYIGVSLFARPTAIQHTQAAMFVDVFRYSGRDQSLAWERTASVPDLKSLLSRFLGKERTEEALSVYSSKRNNDWSVSLTADSGLVEYSEKLLAGVIGSASARVMVASVVQEEPPDILEIMDILDETRQAIAYSRELEKVTAELKAANERLKELDRLKDEFISTVTHELRTPLTSIWSLAQILNENPDIDRKRYKNFTEIIVTESDRLTRLIGQVLDFQKFETGGLDWHMTKVNIIEIINDSVKTTSRLMEEKNILLELDLPESVPETIGDRDRLIQVMVNLISNAVKFCRDQGGIIKIKLSLGNNFMKVDVCDNGIGISRENLPIIFEKFRQVREASKGKPAGSGLGLTITKRIIDMHKGNIRAKSKLGEGSVFSFTLPIKREL